MPKFDRAVFFVAFILVALLVMGLMVVIVDYIVQRTADAAAPPTTARERCAEKCTNEGLELERVRFSSPQSDRPECFCTPRRSP